MQGENFQSLMYFEYVTVRSSTDKKFKPHTTQILSLRAQPNSTRPKLGVKIVQLSP